MNPVYPALKRAIDVLTSVLLLTILSPLLIALAATVRIAHGSPVLFRQRRPGFRERPFEVLKFRTMNDARDDRGELLPDSERLTRVGRWMRRWSLDELPQLFNVLAGDLSLVGPRPLLMEYLPLYDATQRRRHEVPPGITGWAQVNGRNALTWEDKFALDVWYVDHRSLPLDLRILWLTMLRVLEGRGVEGYGNIRFAGNEVREANGSSRSRAAGT